MYIYYIYVVSEREYIFACILNELYKQTEFYNNHLTDFLSGNLPDFLWILHRAPQHGGQWWQRC